MSKYPRMELASVTNILADDLEANNSADLEALEAVFTEKYKSPDFIQNLRDEGKALISLPFPKLRIIDRKWARIRLVGLRKDTIMMANQLIQFIGIAYPPEEASVQIEATAISVYRTKALKNSWNAVSYMQTGIKTYLKKRGPELLAKGAMPASFPSEFTAIAARFDAERQAYAVTNSDSMNLTADINDKIAALGDRVMGILGNAQSVFYSNPVKKRLYTYRDLCRRATLDRSAGGIRLGLLDAATDRPVVGAVVCTNHFDLQTTTNKLGRAVLQPLVEGRYTVHIEAEGYQPLVLSDVLVKKGIKRNMGALRVSLV